MKHLTRLLSLFVLVSTGLFLANCKSDPTPPTAEETQLNLLKANTWKISDVEGPTGNKFNEYTGMTVTFSGEFGGATGNYLYESTAPTSSGWPSASPWLATSHWQFGTTVTSMLIMLDYTPSQNMTYTLSSNNTILTIDFNYLGAGFDNGRVNSVTGDWTFEFTK